MNDTPRKVLQIIGLVLFVCGVLILIDGLLPLRSRGPNPSWIEVIVGVILVIFGWLLRRIAK